MVCVLVSVRGSPPASLTLRTVSAAVALGLGAMGLGQGVVTALASLLAATAGYYAAVAMYSSSAVASASVVATRALPIASYYANRAAAASVVASSSAVTSATPKHVLLGVMSNPSNDVLRTGVRKWAARFASHRAAVDVRFVYGTSFYSDNSYNSSAAPDAALASFERERAEHDDFFFVEGREKLPHVGVVTEKSAAWCGRPRNPGLKDLALALALALSPTLSLALSLALTLSLALSLALALAPALAPALASALARVASPCAGGAPWPSVCRATATTARATTTPSSTSTTSRRWSTSWTELCPARPPLASAVLLAPQLAHPGLSRGWLSP